MESIKVLLVDDSVLLRAALGKLLRLWRKDVVVEEASNGREGVEAARRLKPDLVIMDIRMPECNGIEATRLIKAELPDTRIIMLTVSDLDDDLFEAISSGAHGYLLKDLRPEDLFEMIEGALKGEAVISPTMASRILNAFVDQAHRTAVVSESESELTPREREVLELASQGATNKQIAEKLYISVGTVKNHVHKILEKLHLQNRAQIAAYARMRRMIGWN